MPIATVLIPTHDHADTLLYSVRSVQQQTLADFELLVVGDGAPERTREIMHSICSVDSRVRYFHNPKGEAHGEAHRDAALRQARGEYVCYLCDDDLWLPHHLDTMAGLLERSDFAHTLQVSVNPGDTLVAREEHVELPEARERMLTSRWNCFGPTSTGHRMDAYRRLPYGWRPRPEGMLSDLYMWRQWLEQPWCRLARSAEPSTLHFGSPRRKGWPLAQRIDELDRWAKRLAYPRLAEFIARAVAGNQALKARDWIAAERAFLDAVTLYPADAGVWHGLLRALGPQQRAKELASLVDRALEANGN